ncbi:hypothetical protein QAD02_008548 [Eretmocerus hayati]|uniref:Uncharacterized protein n=1 Tax=Eretmocerus hayati TaxID=131215 RepID=A0ACC2N7M3_9HYME|nr:hypothetical protein QAD02_008548 [Eretmocerus hayati]
MVAHNKCCNPLRENVKHSKILRRFSPKLQAYFPPLDKASKICNTCRLKIEKEYLGTDEIAEFSEVSRWIAGKIKKIDTEPETESSRKLSNDVVKQVKSFFESDENSRIMPGMSDTKCVKDSDGQKQYLQKRLILFNLRELYPKFKVELPDLKIGISQFAEFRPPNCVFAGTSLTHVACVCVYHQNIKLMLEGLNISQLTSNIIKDYKDCITKVICPDPTPQCHLNQCEKCPGVRPLMDEISHLLETENIDKIEFKSWLTTDRASLQTRVVPSEDSVQELEKALIKLKPYSFLAKEQGAFLNKLKVTLTISKFLLILDFAENYQFVVQVAAQSFHSNNDPCTPVTVVIYFWNERNFSSQHFKSKSNFVNLIQHEEDFGLKDEWHFHVTTHGKNACDGIGATIKSTARRESLQKGSSGHILTPSELYHWTKNRFQNMEISFLSKDHYETMKTKLEKRFDNAKTIPGTQEFSCVPKESSKFFEEDRKFSTQKDNKKDYLASTQEGSGSPTQEGGRPSTQEKEAQS